MCVCKCVSVSECVCVLVCGHRVNRRVERKSLGYGGWRLDSPSPLLHARK